MGTITENEADLFTALTDPENKVLPVELLQDEEAVKLFLADFDKHLVIKAMFFYKLKPKMLADLYSRQVIQDIDLLNVFTQTNFKSTCMLDILRSLGFEQRKQLVAKLKAINADIYGDLDEKIDAKYGMVAGILVKSVSEKMKQADKNVFDLLTTMLDDLNSSLDDFKQYADSAVRYKSAEYQEFLQDILKLKTGLLQQPKQAIAGQEEFSQVVKLVYLLCVSEEIRQAHLEPLAIISRRVLASLYLFNDSQAITLILQQLPQVVVKDILAVLNEQRLAKMPELRNRALTLLKLIPRKFH
jgi:hypothetical protein